MLIQFTVGNFLSFKEKTTFSMVASPDEPGHTDRVVKLTDDLSVLRIAAIYGANASGKSNLLKAMAFAQNLIVNGTRPIDEIPQKPFLLDDDFVNNDSFFEFIFSFNKKIFCYGFTCNKKQIQSEWLKDAISEKTYFERSISKINLSDNLIEYLNIKRERLEFITEDTRSNQLFLFELYNRDSR